MVEVINKAFDFLFGWTIDKGNLYPILSPLLGIIFISFVLSMISTLAWKYLTDQILLKSLREKSSSMREDFKKYKNDPKKMAELNSKMTKENFEIMKLQYKQSIKPMIATLIPFAFVFIWIRKTYEPFGAVFLGLGGIWTYIIFSIVFSMILRKVMKVY